MAIYKSASSTPSSSFEWIASFFHNNRNSLGISGDNTSMTALGGTAAVGVLVVVRWLLSSTSSSSTSTGLLEGYRKLLQSLVRGHFPVIEAACTPQRKGPDLMEYHGSCHCESVLFKMRAPTYLDVVHGSGKIPYPQTKVEASHFTLTQGSEYLRIYHAYNENEVPPSTLAYSFCSECAVHIVNASDSNANEVSVNVNCVHQVRKREAAASQNNNNNNNAVSEELDEICSLPPPQSPVLHHDLPQAIIDVDRSSPVSNITQPLPKMMTSINEVGDSWVLHDPSRPTNAINTSLQVDTIEPIKLTSKLPSSRTSASTVDWPTESESNSVYSGSYVSRSTFDLGSIDGSTMLDEFAEADTASRQEMLMSMRKYLKKSSSRKLQSTSTSSLQSNSNSNHHRGTIPPRPPVSLPS